MLLAMLVRQCCVPDRSFCAGCSTGVEPIAADSAGPAAPSRHMLGMLSHGVPRPAGVT